MVIIYFIDKLLTFSNIIYYLIFSISLIIGGYWTYKKFIKRHEDASINLEIINIKILTDKIRKRTNILIEVQITNTGKREVLIYYDFIPGGLVKKDEDPNRHYKSEISYYFVNKNEELEKVGSKIGLTTGENKQHTGRLRIGVNTKIPYLLPVTKPGIYFFEYKVDINMTRFYKGKDKETVAIKTWSTRMYYNITETELLINAT